MSDEPERHEFRVLAADAGMRLDRFLADAMPSRSRTFLRRLIDAGQVTVKNKGKDTGRDTGRDTGKDTGRERSAAPAHRIEAGCAILVTIPPPPKTDLARWKTNVPMLFEDDHLLVVDKPAAWVTHPGAGHPERTLLNALLHAFPEIEQVGSPKRPGIVHRLDRGTSGVLVAARTESAYLSLVDQFSKREVRKLYLAIAHGTPIEDQGTIERPIGRDRFHRQKFSVRSSHGKPAMTSYRITETAGPFVRVRLSPSTGRTHQIRVHLASIGLPLVGDQLYGRNNRALPPDTDELIAKRDGAFLHAHRLSFRHPATGKEVRFTAREPEDFHSLWRMIRETIGKHA